MRILSGLYKNRELKTPKGDRTRPTTSKVRKSIFDILQHQIEGARFLDLFAGSGAMGIEALSRGAEKVVFIEKDPQAAHCIRQNLTLLGIQAPLFQTDAQIGVKKLKEQKAQFDLIYLDPPYTLDIHPLLEQLSPLLAEEGLLLLEQSKKREIHPSTLTKIDERTFGDTTIYFFKIGI